VACFWGHYARLRHAWAQLTVPVSGDGSAGEPADAIQHIGLARSEGYVVHDALGDGVAEREIRCGYCRSL
jgi:hypothetical protein